MDERGEKTGLRLTLDRPERAGRPAGRSTTVLLLVIMAIGAFFAKEKKQL